MFKENRVFYLQKIIATSISFLTNGQTVVETLNSYHALPVKKEELEQQFRKNVTKLSR